MNGKKIDELWQKALKESVEANEQFTRYRFAVLLEEEFFKEDVLTTAYMTGFQAGRDYEGETNLNCKSVQKRLATTWGYVKTEQAEQEPVAWMYVNKDGECEQIEYGEPFNDPSVTPLYTVPVRTKDLTDDEINELWLTHGQGQMMYIHEKFARAVIAADREKNK